MAANQISASLEHRKDLLAYNWGSMCIHFLDQGLFRKAEEMIRMSFLCSNEQLVFVPNTPRIKPLLNVSRILFSVGRYQEIRFVAAVFFQHGVPDSTLRAYAIMANYHIKKGIQVDAKVCEKMVKIIRAEEEFLPKKI